MYSIDGALTRIHEFQAQFQQAEKLRIGFQNSSYQPAQRDELVEAQDRVMANLRSYQQQILRDLLRFPPHKVKHFENVTQFNKASPFEQSVFVMTKFTNKDEDKTPLDLALDRVINAVRTAIDGCNGHRSYLAWDKNWSEFLWENVETYLMACGKAVAIVESRHTPELNPNVTMEWGWLRATERRVLFLVEKTFDKARADLSGLTREEFDWDNPEPGITAAVKKFLTT
jgi:hypothetical protein